MLNQYLTGITDAEPIFNWYYRCWTNIYMNNPYLTYPCTIAELILTDFLIQINIYEQLTVTCQNLINAYIIKPIFNWPRSTSNQ